MVLVSSSQFVDCVLEDLSTVDFLFQRTARDEAVHHNIHCLTDAKRSVHRLRVGSWVPAWVNYSQSQHHTV